MLCSMLFSFFFALIGILALIKGEIKLTAKRKISDLMARIMGGVLILGSLLGAFLGIHVTLITLIITILIGVMAVFFIKNPLETRELAAQTGSASYQSGSSYIYAPSTPAYSQDISSTLAQSAYHNIPEVNPYEPVYIPGTLLDAATPVDTYPSHSDFVVYDIRSSFKRKPGQPAVCPKCGGSLKCITIKPSRGIRVDLNTNDLLAQHRFSYLFTCAKCKWWALRESWMSPKMGNRICDYLVIGGIPINNSTSIIYNEFSNDRNPEPWNKALIFPDLYDEFRQLPGYLAKIFPLK